MANSPRSFRLHYMMARSLYEQDALGNIDRVIAEDEAACMILSPLPPSRSIEFPSAYLGVYYATKADLVAPGQRTAWLEKSLASLLNARGISQAVEKAYDDIQRAHGSLTARSGDPQLYLYLAATEMKLGKFQDAVEALRYGLGINPRTLALYDGLNQAYSQMGELPQAVTAMEEKALTDNFQAATMRALRALYQQIPDGQCAFVASGAGWQLNTEGCARVKSDFCVAYGEVAQAYRKARIPEGAQWAQAAGRARFGCVVQ
jgi:tetratricopeptide (TPR) repeat protein